MNTRIKKREETRSQNKIKNRKNFSMLGVSLIAASTLVSTTTNVVLAESLDQENNSNNHVDVKNHIELLSLESPSELTESIFKSKVKIKGTSINNVKLSISPNVKLLDEKVSLFNEIDKEVGFLEINKQLNQLTINVEEGIIYNELKFELDMELKNLNMKDQQWSISYDEQYLNSSLTYLNQKNEENSIEEKVINTEESIVESESKELEPIEIKDEIEEKEELSDTQETNETESSTKDSTEETFDSASTTSLIDEKDNSDNTSTTELTEKEPIKEDEVSTETSVQESTSESIAKEDEETKEVFESIEVKAKTLRMMAPQPLMARSVNPQQDFVNKASVMAQQVAAENNLYASVMIAQSILESGYGQSSLAMPPNHNLFGIKGAYKGQSVNMPTWEVYGGQNVTVNAKFRKYPSYKESYEDNARLIRTTSFYPGNYFYSGAWKENAPTYQHATKALTGKYATDPNYNHKLNNIIVAWNLTQYDTPKKGNQGGGTPNANKPNTSTTTTPKNTSNSYTVKGGDTLYWIAINNNTTVNEIKRLNGLKSDLIYVGQSLKLKDSSGSKNTNTQKPKVNTQKPNTKPKNANNSYTVKGGDTLYRIAINHNTTVNEIKRLNGLKSDLIYVGQSLKLNGSVSKVSESKQVNKNTNTQNKYTVKSGDTLYRIAINHNTTVNEIKRLNNLKSDMIYVGQSLNVKGNQNKTYKNDYTTNRAKTHKIIKGDTLWSLSRTYGTSVNEIKRLNNLKSDVIYVGQILKIK